MEYCSFHPLQSAHNHCVNCQKEFCLECSNEQGGNAESHSEQRYFCFICDAEMQPLTERVMVPPFWRNLSHVYRYPSSMAALLTILVVSLMMMVTKSTIFVLIPSMMMMHYSFLCLRSSAQGYKEAPSFEECFEGSINSFLSFFCIACIGVGFVAAVTYLLGNGFGVIAGLLCLLSLPASIIILCIDDSLNNALNPSRLWSAIVTMGASYFFAFLFAFMMLSSVIAISYFIGSADTLMNRFFLSVVSNYYSIVIFHILGYLVYQNAPQLGFGVKQDGPEQAARSNDKIRNAHIDVLIKAGAYHQAIDLCAQQIKSGRANHFQWKRCLKLLLVSGKEQDIEGFAERYFAKLKSDNLSDSVADDYIEIKSRVSHYEPQGFDLRLFIAHALNELGRYKHVVILLRRFASATKDKNEILTALTLLSDAYAKIPGQEKNAQRCQQQHKFLSAAV